MYFITWCSPAALWLFHIPFHERIAVRVLSSLLICRPRTDFFSYFNSQGISQVSSFHILFHRVFASFMAISHPFSQDHTFCRDLFFNIFTGYFTGKFSSHFLSSVLSVVQTHTIFICFSLFISHTIYVKYSVKRGSPFHMIFTSFSQGFFTAFFTYL